MSVSCHRRQLEAALTAYLGPSQSGLPAFDVAAPALRPAASRQPTPYPPPTTQGDAPQPQIGESTHPVSRMTISHNGSAQNASLARPAFGQIANMDNVTCHSHGGAPRSASRADRVLVSRGF